MMQRRTHAWLLYLIVCALGTLSVVFWPAQGNALRSSALAAQVTRMQGERFAVKNPPDCSQQLIIHSLLKPGVLEIWNTGALSVPANTHFDPRRYLATIPYGKPLFTGANLDPHGLSMGKDQLTGYYFINFSMKGAAASALTSFTSHNIGNYITITLNRVVVSSPMLRYKLPGKGQFQMSPHALELLDIKCAKP